MLACAVRLTYASFDKVDENEELSKKTSSPEKITDPTPVHPPYPPAEQPDPTVTPPQEFPSPKSEEVL